MVRWSLLPVEASYSFVQPLTSTVTVMPTYPFLFFHAYATLGARQGVPVRMVAPKASSGRVRAAGAAAAATTTAAVTLRLADQ